MSNTTSLPAQGAWGPRGGLMILVALVIAEIISSFEISMIYAALPTISREFADPVGAGWLITAYLLVGSVSAGLSSRLGDVFGRQRMVLAMLACSAVGSLISALSTELGGLIAGRALQGMSAALLPLSVGIVRQHLPTQRVPIAVGWITAMAAFSAGAGLLLGGVLVDNLGWRTMFWFGTAHGLLAMVLVVRFVPNTVVQAVRGRLDWLGGVLYAPAVALLLWALSRIKGLGLTNPTTLTALATGVLLLVVWGRREWRHPTPMIDVRQIVTRSVGLPMVLMFLFGLGTAQLMLVLMTMAQQPIWTGVGLGLTATMAGFVKLPSNFMGLFGAPWGGHLAARHGARRAAVLSAFLILLGWCGLIVWHHTAWLLMAWAMVMSFGGAMMMSAVPNLLVEVVPSERTSEFVGLAQVVRTLGSAIGTQVASVLMATQMVRNDAQPNAAFPSSEAYLLTMAFIIIVCALCWFAAWTLPRRPTVMASTA